MNKRQIISFLVLSGLLIISLLIVPMGLAKSLSEPTVDTTSLNSNSTISPKSSSPHLLSRSPAPATLMSGVFSDVLTVTKQISGSLIVGLPLTYNLTISHSGLLTDANNVIVTDTLPAGATYLSSTAGGQLIGGNTVSWTIPSLLTGTKTTVSFVVTTCSASLTNSHYRAVSSDEGLFSHPGLPLASSLTDPTLVAGFDTDPTIVTVGANAFFTDTSTTDGSVLVGWQWDFGDGGTGSGQTTSHSYATLGDYSARLTITDTCGYTGTVTAPVSVRAPDLAISKRASPEPVDAGQTLTYTIVLTNNGQGYASGGIVSDTVPPDTAYVSNSVDITPAGAGTEGSPPALITGLNVDPGQVVTITYQVTVNTPLTDGLRITNTASASSTQVPSANLAEVVSEVSTTPQVTVTKIGPALSLVGQTTVFTFSVSNSGNTRLQVNAVHDSIAGDASYDSGNTNGDNWLDLTETWLYTATYVIPPDTPDPLNNTVTVTATDPLAMQVTASNDHVTAIDFQPALSIDKTGPTTAAVGDVVTYTITVQHGGGSDQSDINTVVVSDTRATIINPNAPGGDTGGDDILSQGETWIYTATYQIQPTDTEPLDNIASVSGKDRDTESVSEVSNGHSLTNILYAPAFTVTKTGPSVAILGQTIYYTITLRHNTVDGDSSPIQNVQVNDSLLGSLTGSETGDDGDGRLEGGETWTYTVSYPVPSNAPDPLTNTVTVTGQDLDSEPVSPVAAVHSVDIDYRPTLAISKTGPATALVGQMVNYVITVQHAGTVDTSDINTVVVSDTRGTIINPNSPSGDVGDDDILSQGETWTYTATYQVQSADPDPLPNTASVSGRDLDDDPVPEVSDGHQVNIDFQPNLSINKTGPSVALVSEVISYTITVEHAPGVDQSDINTVVVSDTRATVVNPNSPSGDVGDDNILSQGETWIYTATYQVLVTDPDPLPNTASVSGRARDNQPVAEVSDGHSLDIDFRPALTITKIGQPSGEVNNPVNYHFNVRHDLINGDGSPIQNVSLNDDVLGTPILILGDIDFDQILDAGENWLYNSLYVIPPDSPSPLVNIATVSGQDIDLDPVPPMSDTHSMPINFNPALKLTKFGPTAANVGDTIAYTFTIETAGAGASIHSLLLTDTLVGLPTYISGDTDDNDILDMGETWLYSTTYTIPVTAPNLLINYARASGEDASAVPVSANSSHALVIHFNPLLTITKSGPALVQVGETAIYTFTVMHAPASDDTSVNTVTVTDTIAGVADYAGGDANLNDSLDMGETWTFTAAYTVQADDLEPLLNQGSVSGLDREGEPIPIASDSHSMNIEYNPTLAITILAQNTAYVGQTVSFTYTVSPGSDGSSVQAVEVYDDLAQAATFISGDTNGNNWLDNGETWLFGASYTVLLTDPANLSHTATVTASDRDGDTVVATSPIHPLTKSGQPDLSIAKSGPATAISGELITYTLTVTNSGPVPAHNLVITDVVPAGTVYKSSGGGSESNGIVSWNISRLDPSQSLSFDLSVNIQDNALNEDYGVRADGGLESMGLNVVTTSVTYQTFLPVVLKPSAVLYVFNNNTGGPVTVRVLELGTNAVVASCTVPNNLTQLCGEFPPGTYNVEVSSVCGSGTFARTYDPGMNTSTASCAR